MSPGDDLTVALFDPRGHSRSYFVPGGWTADIVVGGGPGVGTLSLDTLAPQQGFSSIATATEDVGYDPTRVERMEIELTGSGAIDSMTPFG